MNIEIKLNADYDDILGGLNQASKLKEFILKEMGWDTIIVNETDPQSNPDLAEIERHDCVIRVK